MDMWTTPDPDELREQANEYYLNKYLGGMDPEKGDKDTEVSKEELEEIDRFLRRLDEQNYPPFDD